MSPSLYGRRVAYVSMSNGSVHVRDPGTDEVQQLAGGGGYYCEIRIYLTIEIGSVIMFNRTGMSDERYLDEVTNIF